MKTKIVALFLTLPLLASAGNLTSSNAKSLGTNSGGGSAKPQSSIASENLQAILNSSEVNEVFGFNFGIEKIVLSSTDKNGYHYNVTAKTRSRSEECKIAVVVWNSDAALVKQVKVTSLNVVSGCEIENPPPSVFETYEKVFNKFESPVDFEGSYEKYLKVVQELTPELRQEIKESMKLSDPAFYKVLSLHSKMLTEYLKKNPRAQTQEVLVVLYKIMGVSTDAGLYMPALLALKLVPFFTIDK